MNNIFTSLGILFLIITIFMQMIEINYQKEFTKDIHSRLIYQETQMRFLEDTLCSDKWFIACWEILENLQEQSNLYYNK